VRILSEDLRRPLVDCYPGPLGVAMGADKRILSLTVALAGLMGTVPAQGDATATTPASDRGVARGLDASTPDEDNDFVLLPGADPDGSVTLQHASHSSHSSHSSHRSHHSSR
jgi:hypothetical protein